MNLNLHTFFILLILPFYSQGKENRNFFPVVEDIRGQVLWYNSETGQYTPANQGLVFSKSTRLLISGNSHLVFSCPVGIVGRVSGPAEIILKPAQENRYEANLKRGTIAILLDPERPRGSPEFSVRTKDGLALAKGTFYAITEYKGQTFVKVKTGSIKAKPKPPIKRDFAAYKKLDLGKSSKN